MGYPLINPRSPPVSMEKVTFKTESDVSALMTESDILTKSSEKHGLASVFLPFCLKVTKRAESDETGH